MANHATVPSIFISYSRRNSAFVEKLVAELKATGHKVWIDRKDIHPTANWLDTLRAGIAESDCFAAVLTPDLLASDICRVGMNQAFALRKTIVPILLYDIEPLSAEIAQFQWVERTFLSTVTNCVVCGDGSFHAGGCWE
jgi:hypothetical protein